MRHRIKYETRKGGSKTIPNPELAAKPVKKTAKKPGKQLKEKSDD